MSAWWPYYTYPDVFPLLIYFLLRMSAEQMSDSPHPLTPSLNLRPDSTSPCHLKPKPPSPHPPTKTSLFRTHGLHRIMSASNKSSKPPPSRTNTTEQDDVKSSKSKHLCSFPTKQGHLDAHHRGCLNVNSERNSPSPENHLSSQSCIPLQNTGLSPHRQRKYSSAWTSKNINIASSLSAPALSHVADAGSYSIVDTGHSVSKKTQDEQQVCNTGNSSESTVQLVNRERMSSSRSSAVSETPAQPGRKKLESLIHRNKMGHLRLNTSKQHVSDVSH